MQKIKVLLGDQFSSKLQIYEEDDVLDENILKASFHDNINFELELDALETDQIVVSATRKGKGD